MTTVKNIVENYIEPSEEVIIFDTKTNTVLLQDMFIVALTSKYADVPILSWEVTPTMDIIINI